MNYLIKNSSILFVEEFLVKLFNFLTIAVITRSLAPESFGEIVTGTALFSNLILFADCGIRTVALIETAKPMEIRKFTPNELFTVRLLSHVLLLIATVLILSFLPLAGSLKTVLLIYTNAIVIEAIFTDWYFRGSKKYLPSALARVSSGGLFLVATIIICQFSITPSIFAVIFSVSHIATALVLLMYSPVRISIIPLNQMTEILKTTLPVGGGKILQQLPIYLPPLLITAMVSSNETAFFGTAFKVIAIAMVTDRILNILFLGELPTRWHTNQDKTAHEIRILYRNLLSVSAMFVITFAIFGADILHLLFGEEYRSAAPTLKILSLFFLFTLLNSIVSHSIIALKESMIYLRVSVIAAAVTLPLLPLLTYNWGSAGAALSISLAEGAIFIFSAREMRKLIPIPLRETALFIVLNVLLVFPFANIITYSIGTLLVIAIIFNTVLMIRERKYVL